MRKLERVIPRLRYGIINLNPAKQEFLPSDYDGVVDRRNDIIFYDRTLFDENMAILLSDFATFAEFLIKLAEEKGVSKDELQKIFDAKTRSINLVTGKQIKYDDLLKARVDVDCVVRLERKNDSHTVSNKTFDYSKTTIRQLIKDGYEETKEQMKDVLVRIKTELG